MIHRIIKTQTFSSPLASLATPFVSKYQDFSFELINSSPPGFDGSIRVLPAGDSNLPNKRIRQIYERRCKGGAGGGDLLVTAPEDWDRTVKPVQRVRRLRKTVGETA